MKRRTFEVNRAGGLASVVAEALAEPTSRAAERIVAGTVFVDGKRVRDAQRRLALGARVSVVLESGGAPVGEHPSRRVAEPRVLFENQTLVVFDKPPGLPAQPTPSGEANLLEVAASRVGGVVGLVHRLDRETSGVTVFGKTRKATAELAAAFRERKAHKEYLAWVNGGLPAEGRIETPLQRDPSRPGRWRAIDSGNGLSAVTRFQCERTTERGCLVRVFPETGRTHQIRVHLASIGFPIQGDALYGGSEGSRCLLHAQVLEVLQYRWVAPLPDDF